MAHFAELNNDNVVIQVITVHNSELIENGYESESKGISFLQSLFGHNRWKQTSYNQNFRKNYAGVGYFYDQNLDAFIPPRPFNSWTLDIDSCSWIPPMPYPNDGKIYEWIEDNLQWAEI